MRHLILRTIVLTAACGLLIAPGAGVPASDRWSVPLHLTAGAVTFEPVDEGARVAPRIAGFGQSSRPGEPALPIRILMVAIPEGSVPELIVYSARAETLPGLDLAPVPRLRRTGGGVEDGGRGPAQDFVPDARIFGRDEAFPAAPVRLGSTGYLRHQRFVEVLYTPLLYNPVRRTARLYPDIRAEVRFAAPAATALAAPAPPDPFFESTYEAGLVNYEQGRLFRTGRRAGGPGAAPSPVSALEATAAAATATPGMPRYKILVSQPGVYRLDHAYLGANAPDLLLEAADPRTWRLEAEGVEVPISIRSATGGAGEADGAFDTDDFLEFYGQPKSEPPTVLNYDFESILPDIYQSNDFTDTQVYWLTAAEPAGSHLRIPEVNGAPALPGFPQAADFEATVVWEENNLFSPLGAAEPFVSMPSLLAGSSQEQRDLVLAIPGIAPGGPGATVTLRLQGGSSLTEDPDHRTRIWFNGDAAGAADFTWDGEVIHEETFPVSQAALADPSTIHVLAPGIAGLLTDRQYIDTVTVVYRRTFTAAGEELTFTYPNQDARFEVGGLGPVAPVIYEIGRSLSGSNEADSVRITGAQPGGAPTSTYTFEASEDTGPSAPAVRTFIVAGPAALRLPDAMTPAADPVLTTAGNAADIVVIAARDAVDDTPGGALDLLLAHRLATQGLTSRVVFIDQIYDEFSYGLRDANAVRAFLDYAFDNWTGPGGTDPPPSFALLVGDGVLDYKNQLGRSDWVDQVPTPILFQQNSILGYYASDNYLAAFRGADQIPDIHLGRISTRTAVESAAVFDKIRLYETSVTSDAWKGRAVLVAGDGKFVGEADLFEAINDDVEAAYFSAAPYSAASPPLYYEQPPWNASDPDGFRAALIDEIEDPAKGAAVLTVIGHGNFTSYGLDTFFEVADGAALWNGERLPFVLNINCLAGGFHFLLGSGSLGEALLANPSGGAVAVLAPSGLSSTFVGDVVADELFASLFGAPQERVLGAATAGLRAALWSRGSITDLQSYVFLGDPATVLVTPAPPPPEGLGAAAGNGQVDLSWSAPPVPVAGVRLYRSAADPAGPYEVVDCTPVSATSCSDLTVINATRYYYYAVSVDTGGFEGPASNLNSDCDGGPDCVTALPINPGPPATPTGLSAVDTGTGGTLLISWDPHPERDVSQFTLYYGIASGTYGASATAPGGATSLSLEGLADGTRYYLVLSATNTSGHESPPGGEVSAVPHLIQGIAPPRTITDLTLSVSGTDLVLLWSRPLVDIYDRPTVVTGYHVYRGDSPGFQPAAGNLIATLADGAITTFTDPGAVTDPVSAYYLVTAFDAGGFESGAGHDLPNGIGDLSVSSSGPDMVHLEWSEVTTDVQGMPTLIDHYEIYISAAPIARAGLGAPHPGLDNVTGSSIDLSIPESPRFLSVIAVDSRGNLSPF